MDAPGVKTQPSDEEEDNDLADLLGPGNKGPTIMEAPASGRYAQHQQRVYQSYYQRQKSMSCCDYVSAYISVCCYYHPILCSLLAFVTGFFLLLLLVSLVFNPTEQFGLDAEQSYFYSHNVHSKYDLSMNQIDHWCLTGGDASCPYCEDPLVPLSRMEHASWTKAFNKNKGIVEEYVNDPLLNAELDVAFLGGSVVELMAGRWMGTTRPVTDDDKDQGDEAVSDLNRLSRIFKNNFQSIDKGIHGVALGIAGDASPHVLYRIMHGEMPDGFDPKVWWLHIGMNDLARMQCSEEVTIIGILRIVEEILERKPKARIVINSLFPMTTMRKGDYPVLSDYRDTFARPGRVSARHLALTQEMPKESKNSDRRALSLTPINFTTASRRQPSSRNLRERGRDERTGRVVAREVARERTPEQIAQLAAREEQMRDHLARRRHRVRERLNPLLNGDKTKIRKFRPGFLGRTRLPLWASIRQINKELSDFAKNNQPRVYFFESTPLFVQQDPANEIYRLMSSRLSGQGHPREEGYRLWESEILNRLHVILDQMKTEDPDLFVLAKPPEQVTDWDNTKEEEEVDMIDEVWPDYSRYGLSGDLDDGFLATKNESSAVDDDGSEDSDADANDDDSHDDDDDGSDRENSVQDTEEESGSEDDTKNDDGANEDDDGSDESDSESDSDDDDGSDDGEANGDDDSNDDDDDDEDDGGDESDSGAGDDPVGADSSVNGDHVDPPANTEDGISQNDADEKATEPQEDGEPIEEAATDETGPNTEPKDGADTQV